MASRAIRAIVTLLFAAAATLSAGATPQQQDGAFALYRGTPQIVSHVRLMDGNMLDIAQYPEHSSAPLVRYVHNEGEAIHVILVRDDFRSFEHVHARYGSNGHYYVRVVLDDGHRYYAYVASRPNGAGPQVFRFMLQAGAPPHHVATSLLAPSTQSLAGPYRISLNSARFAARKSAGLEAQVFARNGKLVGVKRFSGARAHTVFVSPATLEYVHVDAQSSDGKRMRLRIPALAPGTYRMWLQFREGQNTFTAPFTLAAQ